MKDKKMGAVLWSVLTLIFVFLSLPKYCRQGHANGHATQTFNRRSTEYSGWDCDACRNKSSSGDGDTCLETDFVSRINKTLLHQRLHGPLLIHIVSLQTKEWVGLQNVYPLCRVWVDQMVM